MEYTKSYSKSKSFLTGAIAISAVMFMCASCSGKSGHRHPGIADDPAGTYRHHLSEVRKLDKLSTEELAEHINCWQTVRDSVFSLAVRDTSSNPHSSLYSECEELHDSLRMEFCRIAQSNGRTYLDVFVLKEHGVILLVLLLVGYRLDDGIGINHSARPLIDALFEKHRVLVGLADCVGGYRHHLSPCFYHSAKYMPLPAPPRGEGTASQGLQP